MKHSSGAELLTVFGDVNYLGEGGALLLLHEGELWLENIRPPDEGAGEEGSEPERWTIYRVDPERLQVVERDRNIYLVPASWKPDWPHSLNQYDEWFHSQGYIEEIADSLGDSPAAIRRMFCAGQRSRGRAYYLLGEHVGWYELDQYPLVLSRKEVEGRYGEEL